MNPLVAIGFWTGWYWREQTDSIALWVRAVKAKRNGDEIANQKYSQAARAAESRLVALVAALGTFCERIGIDVTAALAAAGARDFRPVLEVPANPSYQATIENALAEISGCPREVNR